MGKSVKQCKLIENMVDIQLGTFDAIGRHEKQLFQEDVELMVKELYKENLFEQKAGRAHISFPNFRRSFTLKKKQFNLMTGLNNKRKKLQGNRVSNL